MKLKLFAAAAVVAFASISSANAASLTPTLTDLGDGYLSTYIGNTVTKGAFSDTFTFSPAVSDSSVVAFLGSISSTEANAISFTSASLNGVSLFSSGTGVPVLSFTGDPVSFTSLTTLVLTVTGTSLKGGSYGGNLNVYASAVPEPATYGMLLAGMGVVAFMARRRKSTPSATPDYSMAA